MSDGEKKSWRTFKFTNGARWIASTAFTLIGILLAGTTTYGVILQLTRWSHIAGSEMFVALGFVFLIYVGAIAFALQFFIGTQAVRFAAAVANFDRMMGKGLLRPTYAQALYMSTAPGRPARALFRFVTRRRLNTGTRPELARYALETATSILPAIPPTGPVSSMGDGVRVDAYRRFLREAVGLTAIDRIDLVLPLAQAYQAAYPGLLADRTTDVEGYLQPLSGKTTLDLIVQFGLPTAAILVSIVALCFSAA